MLGGFDDGIIENCDRNGFAPFAGRKRQVGIERQVIGPSGGRAVLREDRNVRGRGRVATAPDLERKHGVGLHEAHIGDRKSKGARLEQSFRQHLHQVALVKPVVTAKLPARQPTPARQRGQGVQAQVAARGQDVETRPRVKAPVRRAIR